MRYKRNKKLLLEKKAHYTRMLNYLDEKQKEYKDFYTQTFGKCGENVHTSQDKYATTTQTEISAIVESFNAMYRRIILETNKGNTTLQRDNQNVSSSPTSVSALSTFTMSDKNGTQKKNLHTTSQKNPKDNRNNTIYNGLGGLGLGFGPGSELGSDVGLGLGLGLGPGDENQNNPIQPDKYLQSPLLYSPYLYSDFVYPAYFTQQPVYTLQRKKVTIQKEIHTIDDILELIKTYPITYDVEYNIHMEALHKIKEPLSELNSMIGMKSLKNVIVDQIIYFIQGLQSTEGDFMHSCIYGPPGTGKTEIAKVMGKIFSQLGILKKSSFKKVTRSDLVAGYLGQTAMKTRDVIKDALGGVLFIDEAYALGNPEKRDSFAKECIDTLCEALSEHKEDLMVIIAGYENDLNKCFFAFNQGLNSRFTWRFKTDDYTYKELRQIFLKKIYDAKWSVYDDDFESHVPESWFRENMKYFKYYGRDMETLFSKVKIAHSRRVFCLDADKKKKITQADLERGFKMYLENDEVKKRKDGGIPEYARAIYN
jgi:SpoVK/Ycf46/Vps4 family AAA+-type ATPase